MWTHKSLTMSIRHPAEFLKKYLSRTAYPNFNLLIIFSNKPVYEILNVSEKPIIKLVSANFHLVH